jgi:hypothetical protein
MSYLKEQEVVCVKQLLALLMSIQLKKIPLQCGRKELMGTVSELA